MTRVIWVVGLLTALMILPVAGVLAAGDTGQGEKVFDQTCKTCHGEGIAGAPEFGDKAAWADRIAQGMETLEKHAINGFTGKTGTMPPKGGNAALSDDEVKAAVEYMVANSK